MAVLTATARRFDVLAIQEVRDTSETTVGFFVDRINELPGPRYAAVSGPRLGRSSSKEQYAYIYNTVRVSVLDGSTYTFDDKDDVFEREPYLAAFRVGDFDFVLVNIHTKPDDATAEIRALTAVVDDALRQYPNEDDIIILGDFNADCTFFDEEADATPLEAANFLWIISDSADTTTKSTDCTYDRIVVREQATGSDYAQNWGVFRFDQAHGLSQKEMEAVSDHFPVWADFFDDRDDDGPPPS
jgi:endonuclease/exonuclease/phosphatase family metal-dependent hydrolase